MVTCGHFPWMPGERGGDATGNMEHAINAIHCKKRDEKPQIFYDEKTVKYLSVRLCSHGCAFAWFFHRGFLFSSGFGDVSSHASGATKEPRPIKWLNKDRKLPPKIFKPSAAPPSPT